MHRQRVIDMNPNDPDDPTELQIEIFENRDIDTLVCDSLTNEDSNMAKILYYFFSEKYNIGEDDNWYMFQNHIWHKIGRVNNELMLEGVKKIKDLYGILLYHCEQNGIDMTKIRQIRHIMNGIGKARKIRDVMETAQTIFSVENNPEGDFVSRLDMNRHLIGFNNGIFDLKYNEFRDGRVDDYVTMTVGYDYVPHHTHMYEGLERFIEDIQPNRDERDYMLTYLSRALYKNVDELFTIMVGHGQNGKSELIGLIEQTFGDYYGTLSNKLFTRRQRNASQPDQELLDARYKKIIIAHESERREKLNGCFVGFISRTDSVAIRARHSNKMVEFRPQFITLFACDDIPRIDLNTERARRRLRCINFPTEFCDNPQLPHQRKMDIDISEHIGEWKQDFMLLLLGCYKRYVENRIMIPVGNVLMWANRY
jgi:phage/plasmid-associated DNA primase